MASSPTSYLCCMLYTYIHTATYVLQRAATVIARRHTEVPANERVSQEQSPSLYERRTAHLLQGGVASYHLPHLLTNKGFQHTIANTNRNTNTPLCMRKGPRASPHLHGGGVASFSLSTCWSQVLANDKNKASTLF